MVHDVFVAIVLWVWAQVVGLQVGALVLDELLVEEPLPVRCSVEGVVLAGPWVVELGPAGCFARLVGCVADAAVPGFSFLESFSIRGRLFVLCPHS